MDVTKIPGLIDEAKRFFNTEVRRYCREIGTTAVPVAHIWVHEDGHVELRQGFAPPVQSRPDYLKGEELEVGGLMIDGTVRKLANGAGYEYVGGRGRRSGFRRRVTPKGASL